ncbi:hypothetical protein [Aquimarina sp. MMG016]|uniref:hypothetical protein n=1 Tax=Aquimarina sp. MMG016 TaxID=2822690 RepID=UPI001B3A76A7|nr:hypothetical protein [Aquimarina sp. MMG016]MBQ4819852.1 hypothetical protein [Aquimarina sp. MMG016]
MKSKRHIIASIFLIVFSFMQLADLHVLDHDANDVDCTICLLALDHQDLDYIPSEIVTIPEINIIPSEIVRSTYVSKYFGSSLDYSLSNKAPPAA